MIITLYCCLYLLCCILNLYELFITCCRFIPLNNICPIPPLPIPWWPPSYCFYEFDSFRKHRLVESYNIRLSLSHLTWHNALKVHPLWYKWQDTLLFHDWSTGTWKEAQTYESSWKCKSKQWNINSHLLGWPSSKRCIDRRVIGEDRKSLCTVGGNVNWYKHYQKQHGSASKKL